MREFYQRDCNQAAALALCRPWLLFFLLEGTPARRSFAPDVPRARASSAALDGIKSRTGRRSSGIRYRFIGFGAFVPSCSSPRPEAPESLHPTARRDAVPSYPDTI